MLFFIVLAVVPSAIRYESLSRLSTNRGDHDGCSGVYPTAPARGEPSNSIECWRLFRGESASIRVDQSLTPISPYGVHKKIVEELCQSYARHFGLHCAIVRLFSVYGIGLRKQLLWDACQKFSSGDFIFAGTGRETRDWLNIEDAARLLFLAASKTDPACPIVNGGSGAGIMVRQVVQWIAEALGCAQRPSFSGHARPGDPTHLVADITETRAWGWSPKRNLRDDIAGYVDWFTHGAS